MHPALKLALDLAPLAAFFIGFRLGGLMAATAALLVITALALAVSYIKEKKISPMPLLTGGLVAVFGGLTLALHDEVFIKMKPTLLNTLFAVLLLGGVYLRRPALKYLLGSAIRMDAAGWRILSLRWALFFLFLAGLNEVVWRNFPTEFWVNFKVFGMFSLTLLFTLLQIPLMKRHALPQKEEP
ncbi:MAG: septation protein A [Alphaproteobacteria bacterium]|nr:septation protein A [Alphaproteobacteria bacterium]